jgi:hypothetical protein
MKFGLLFSIMLVIVITRTTSAGIGDPDPWGIVDTVALEMSVDWSNNQVVVEVYCFTDYDIFGSTIGFTWGNSTVDLIMDSAVATDLLTDVSDYGPFFYESDSILTTNTNERFILGTLSIASGIPGDATGRRLWASYYFTIDWEPYDCVIIDTLTFSGSSTFLYDIGDGNGYTPSFYNHILEDIDQDEIISGCDNCPNNYNPLQEDSDGDGIGDACCCIVRGDCNLPSDGLVQVDDLSFLVDYLFNEGASPECLEQGDCATPLDGNVFVNDLSYLVYYLFKSGPPPPDC